MSRKSVVKSHKMMDAGDMSSTIVSSVSDVLNLDQASIHISWSGAAVGGELFLDARNGESDSWYELDFNVSMLVSTDSGDHQIVLNSMPFTQMRLRYVPSAGTGSMTATLTMKVVGA